MSFENIDDRVDWPSFYRRYIDRLPQRARGDVACTCPFDKHTNKSAFSINMRTGQWQCFACGTSGNAYDFLQQHAKLSPEAAVDEVRKAAGLPPKGEGGDVVPLTKAKMTIEAYADAKQLDVAFLKELGLRNPAGNGRGMAVPYLNADGVEVATRYRQVSSPSTPKFLWKKGSRTHLYGLWRLDRVMGCERKRVIIVEGESDCHTMWQRGYDETIGVPGSNTFRSEWAQYLPTDRPVYYIREPGMSGDQLHDTLCKRLTDAGWGGQLFEMQLHDQGAKDPSDLHINHGPKFDTIIESAIQVARPVDFVAAMLKPEEIVPGFPALRQPSDYRLDAEKGIMAVTKEGVWYPVCHVPVGLNRRLRMVDSGEEKIEVLYRRDGQVRSIATERTSIATVRGITQLANRGLPVHDGNARHLVGYLAALEAENPETLPVHRCVDRMGWVDSKTFLPGVAPDDVYLDVPDGTRRLADAYHANGDPNAWLELAGHVRNNHPTARLMLAASFAAPLLGRLRQRVFLLHAWGPSRGGKTAATKLAMSVWGQPEDLLQTFNATKVALEQTAAFYSDLPLGVDELQVTDAKTGENIVYMLSLGKGRGRGARGGGLMAAQAWRSIIITTGEQPLTNENSHGGVVSRAVEVWGEPISGDEALARRLHQATLDTYGHAGPAFINHLLGSGDMVHTSWGAMLAALEAGASANTSSHVSSIAVCALADYLSGVWLFGLDDATAWAQALALGVDTLAQLDKAADTDYATKAREFINGWRSQHHAKFQDDAVERYGAMQIDDLRPEKSVCWIIPAVLYEALDRGGFNARRVLADFADRGWIKTEMVGTTRRNTVRSRALGAQTRLVGFRLTQDSEIIEPAQMPCDPAKVF